MARTVYKSHRLVVGEKVTAVSLEPQWWSMLEDVCSRQNRSVRWVLQKIERNRGDLGRPTAIQLYITKYYMDIVKSREKDDVDLQSTSMQSETSPRISFDRSKLGC